MSKEYRRKNKIAGQFSARTIEMMESPAFMVLSLSARRILDRLEIEHGHHAGNDNGDLPCTYDHFHDYGIHRHAIAPGIREAVALGFLEITEKGRSGNAEWRRPNKFRLTYRQVGRANPTDEWRRVKTIKEAEMLAKAARNPVARPQKKPAKSRPEKHFPSDEKRHFLVTETIIKEPTFHSAETITTGHSAETITTSISRTLAGKVGRGSQALMREGHGQGSHRYTLSADPRAFEPFSAIVALRKPMRVAA
jgi:hypothetical protein